MYILSPALLNFPHRVDSAAGRPFSPIPSLLTYFGITYPKPLSVEASRLETHLPPLMDCFSFLGSCSPCCPLCLNGSACETNTQETKAGAALLWASSSSQGAHLAQRRDLQYGSSDPPRASLCSSTSSPSDPYLRFFLQVSKLVPAFLFHCHHNSHISKCTTMSNYGRCPWRWMPCSFISGRTGTLTGKSVTSSQWTLLHFSTPWDPPPNAE